MEKAPVLAEGFDGTMGNVREAGALTLVGAGTLLVMLDLMKRRCLEVSLQVTVPVP